MKDYHSLDRRTTGLTRDSRERRFGGVSRCLPVSLSVLLTLAWIAITACQSEKQGSQDSPEQPPSDSDVIMEFFKEPGSAPALSGALATILHFGMTTHDLQSSHPEWVGEGHADPDFTHVEAQVAHAGQYIRSPWAVS